MPQDAACRDGGYIALEDVQISSADGGLGDPHHGIRRLAQRGLRHVFQLLFPRARDRRELS